MNKAVTKDGVAIIGTVEQLSGVAYVHTYRQADNGRVEVEHWGGETKIWWDEQKSAYDPQRGMIFVGEDGLIYYGDEIEIVENEACGCGG